MPNTPPSPPPATHPIPAPAAAKPAPPMAGKFVSGSVLRHVLTMAATGSIGLVSVFAVDLLNLFYLSLLGQKQLAAAVGYAGTLLFFITSLAIGLSIAVSAQAGACEADSLSIRPHAAAPAGVCEPRTAEPRWALTAAYT